MSAASSEVAQHLAEWTDAVGVAAILGETVPASTIAELGRTERLPSVKLGSRRLFHLPTVSGALMDAMQSGRQL